MIKVNTNLIESYEILMEYIAKHTSDKFFLINNVNTSVRDLLAREIVGNILVHRDYAMIRKITGAAYDKKKGEWSY